MIQTPHPLIEPLVRTLLGIPPSMVHSAPESGQQRLHTLLLRDAPFARDHAAAFDDSCLMTVVEGQEEAVQQVKLVLPGGKKRFSGIHLALLTPQGQLQLTLGGDDLRLFLGFGSVVRAQVVMSQRATLFIGDGCTVGGARLWVTNADLTIGNDCQINEDVVVQTHDQHPITDLDLGEVINLRRRRMRIGRHVWVGRRALLLPDTQIGSGSIVEAGAVVSGRHGPNVMLAGAPAQVVRPRVAWAREFGKAPPPPEVEEPPEA